MSTSRAGRRQPADYILSIVVVGVWIALLVLVLVEVS